MELPRFREGACESVGLSEWMTVTVQLASRTLTLSYHPIAWDADHVSSRGGRVLIIHDDMIPPRRGRGPGLQDVVGRAPARGRSFGLMVGLQQINFTDGLKYCARGSDGRQAPCLQVSQ